jgi:hypothetical protein
VLRLSRALFVALTASLVLAGSAHAFALREFPTGFTSYSGGLVAGSDGRMWFNTSGAIDEIDTDGHVTRVAVPSLSVASGVAVLAPDNAGNVWFPGGANAVGRLSAGGTVSDVAVNGGTGFGYPVTGPFGTVWFVTQGAIGLLGSAGAITWFPVPPSPRPNGYGVELPTAGSDGRLWFADGAATVGAIATDGTVSAYPLAPPADPGAVVNQIASGPDGRMWVVLQDGDVFGVDADGRSALVASGARTGLVDDGPYWPPMAAADGRMWIAGADSELISLTPSGVLRDYWPGQSRNATFYGFDSLARASDGRLWVTERWTGRVAQVTTGDVCWVPQMIGLSETSARTAAKARDCHVRVVRPRRLSGRLAVVSQSVHTGAQKPAGTTVRVVVGHLRPACRVPVDATVVADDGFAVVFARSQAGGEVTLGCVRATGRLVQLPQISSLDQGASQDDHYTLAGTRVAYLDRGETKYPYGYSTVVVDDLATSSSHQEIRLPAFLDLDALALAPSGPVAWIGRFADQPQTLQVWASGQPVTLDTSPSNALAGLTVDLTSVHWTNDGVQKSAPIPAP